MFCSLYIEDVKAQLDKLGRRPALSDHEIDPELYPVKLEKASGKEPEDWNIECCLCECSLDFVNFTERYRGPKNLAGVVVSASCQGRIRPRLRRWLWPSERNQTSCPGALHRVARKRLDA